ncbi:Acetylcholine receptor subunit beta-like 1 [Lamellibrachia satsuma]|nr:Acetylcholine receptor subunit beta-like 1 [Lamellibrachia satsuma]
MKSNVWLRMVWQDYQLEWDPAVYGGIQKIRILPEKVWKPDIVLFNNADGRYEVSYKPSVVISHTGSVLWIPPAIYKSSCRIDVKYFPFDEQECEMKFGSWTFNGDQVGLRYYEDKDRVDLSDYVNSGTWDIITCPGKLENSTDRVDGHIKKKMTFTLQIRRKTLFYTVNLIIPCVLISFLSVSVFYLPADAGEKMTMCISILLALVVFLLLVSKILPPTSISIPLIAKYLLFTFIMNIFTIFITVIIINWNFRTPRTHRMSRWVRVVFLNYLPKLLFMRRPNHDDRWTEKAYTRVAQGRGTAADSMAHIRQQYSSNARSDIELAEMHPTNNRVHTNSSCEPGRPDQDVAGGSAEPAGFRMTPETHKAIEAVRFIAAHLKNEDDYAEVLEDWRYIAMVIDRLQLYIFVAVTIGGTAGILINSPHIFDYVDQDAIKRRITGMPDNGVQ